MQEILTFEEYSKTVALPKTNDIVSQKLNIQRDIADATNMLDNFCAGKIFIEYPTLDPLKPDDKYRVDKLKWAIIETTRLLNMTGKNWFNLSQSVSSQISTSSSFSSIDSNLELNRQDIIANLVAGKWYKNLRTDSGIKIEHDATWHEVEQANLDMKYLRTDGSNSFNGEKNPIFNIESSRITNSGDIISDWNQNNAGDYRNIIGFNLKGTVDHTITSEKADKILVRDILRNEKVYKFLDEVDIHLLKGLTDKEIYKAIAASELSWQEDYNYTKDQIVVYIDKKNTMKWVKSLKLDNIGHNPNAPDGNIYWEYLNVEPIDVKLVIDEIIKELKTNILPKSVKTEVETQLNALPTVKNILFKKGIKYDFHTKVIFDEICKANNILEQDYMLYENSTIFGVGETGISVGDGMIQQNNLPDIRFWFSARYNLFGYENTPSMNNKVPTKFYYDENSPDVTEVGPKASMEGKNLKFLRVGFDLNGGVAQAEFKPKYTETYSVMFLKDIEREQLIEVKNLNFDFKSITGDLLENKNAYDWLNWIYRVEQNVDAGENGLTKTIFDFNSVDKKNKFNNLFICLKDNFEVTEINYNLKDSVETWTGNFLNGKRIYTNRIITKISANTDTVILHNVEEILFINAFFKNANTKKIINDISQVDDGIIIKNDIEGEVVVNITYTKRNGG